MSEQFILNLSQSAVDHVKSCLAKRGSGIGIRIGVRTSGCSGFAYRLEFADAAEESDIRMSMDGFEVLVDSKSAPLLSGITLDYGKEGLSEGFRFANPNEASRCGCGESFSV